MLSWCGQDLLTVSFGLIVDVAIHIKPSSIFPNEAAGFMKPVGFAPDLETSDEFDDSTVIALYLMPLNSQANPVEWRFFIEAK